MYKSKAKPKEGDAQRMKTLVAKLNQHRNHPNHVDWKREGGCRWMK